MTQEEGATPNPVLNVGNAVVLEKSQYDLDCLGLVGVCVDSVWRVLEGHEEGGGASMAQAPIVTIRQREAIYNLQ